MSALLEVSDLGGALPLFDDEVVSESTHQVEDQIRKRLAAHDQLDFDVARHFAERAHRHQQREADDLGKAGQKAYSGWAESDYVWRADDYRKLGFHLKYCTGLYVERARMTSEWVSKLHVKYNLSNFFSAPTVLFDLGCGPGCCTLGYAQAVAQLASASAARPLFKAYGLDPAVEWQVGWDILTSRMGLDCTFLHVYNDTYAGFTLDQAPAIVESMVEEPPQDMHLAAIPTNASVVVIISHVIKDFPVSARWWRRLADGLHNRRALVLVFDRQEIDVPPEIQGYAGQVGRSTASASFVNFEPTKQTRVQRIDRFFIG